MGVDAVVSALGQTSEGSADLLETAGRHILGAMEAHDVDRFVTLVGAGVQTDFDEPCPCGQGIPIVS